MNQNFKNLTVSLKRKLLKDRMYIFISLSFAFFIIDLIANTYNPEFYGYFFDEFYYLDCAKHLAFGYVDHPPFSVFTLLVWTKLFGISLLSVRFLTAVIGSIIIFTVSRITAKLGGGLFSQVLAPITVMIIPNFMAFSGFYSMNIIEVLICCLCFYLLITIIREGRTKLWIPVGILAGIGLLNKHTIIIYIVSIIAGLLLTKERKFFLNIWFLAGLILSFLIFLPNLIWQINNHFPSLEFYTNARQVKVFKTQLIEYIKNFIIAYNPVLFIFWFSGLIFLFFKKDGHSFRLFGWASIFLILFIFLYRDNRVDRILGIFPLLISSGMILFERLSSKNHLKWLRIILIVPIIASGLIVVPTTFPVLKPENAEKYYLMFGFKNIDSSGMGGRLSFTLGAKTGWEEMVKQVADTYNTLPESEKENAGIFGPLYGYSSAINLLGKKYGLPDAMSGHNNCYLWEKDRSGDYDTIIAVLNSSFDFRYSYIFKEFFFETVDAGSFYNKYAPPFLLNYHIYIFKKPKVKFSTIWDKFKIYL